MDGEPRPVEVAVESYRAAAAEIVAEYLSAREPGPHLYDPLRAFMARDGKGLRPALCLAACEAFGGAAGDALQSAAAIELLHAAFLIHDDIEDDSEWRRGEPTLHVLHGVPIALNAGDALAVMCLRPLLDNVDRLGSRLARSVLAEFQATMERTVEGQAIELGWRRDNTAELTPVDYLDMILHKTCAYTTILPLRVGALIGSRGRADLDAISQFGFSLGAAFQIKDDLLDLDADANDGNLMGDISEGKRTLMVIHSLRFAPPAARARVQAFLDRTGTERSTDELREIVDVVDAAGSIAFAQQYADALLAQAEERFDDAFAACVPSPALRFLRDVIPFMTQRAR
ncbi:MAG TPA: polyprenyl synthetase family protein [Acidimicrobiia bacterium]|nr:polyprenyl synthetase family protein [Acidimicrobiia bacterium]